MKINSLLILIFVSIFLVISALASTLIKFNSPIVTSERELAFPRLMKEINQVGKIIITSKGEAFTIVNDNEKWYLKEKNDYPVPRSKVRNFLLELTNLILVERKTKLKELSKRDEENKNYDAFGIFLEPFNDAQVEYNFMVTAAGVQIDRKFSKSGTDNSWDAVWNSAVSINNNGWSIEFSIPFSQLRFPQDNKAWAINMAREIRRYRENYRF